LSGGLAFLKKGTGYFVLNLKPGWAIGFRYFQGKIHKYKLYSNHRISWQS